MPDNETGKPTGLVTVRYYVKNGSHVEILKAELEKDYEGFIAKVEEVHYDCMTIFY